MVTVDGKTYGSRSDYAGHINRSAPYVTKLGHQGRLVERSVGGKTLVDFELTDRLVRNTADLSKAHNGANAKPELPRSPAIGPVGDVGRVDAIFRQAQAQERAYSAKLAELEYKKAIGEVVPAAQVEAELARVFATFREAMLQIPARLSAQLAAETNEARVHQMLALQRQLHQVAQHLLRYKYYYDKKKN
jgi:hypothetical protein